MSIIRRQSIISSILIYLGFAFGALNTYLFTREGGPFTKEEYGLTQEEIIQGIKSGKLRFKKNNMHGNPYLKLIRSEVESFVRKKYGLNHVKKKMIENELKEINREVNSAKRKISVLEKRKAEILNILSKM